MRSHPGVLLTLVLAAGLLAMTASPAPQLRAQDGSLSQPTGGPLIAVAQPTAGHGGSVRQAADGAPRTSPPPFRTGSRTPTPVRRHPPRAGRPVRNTGHLPQTVGVPARPVGDMFGVGTYFVQRGDSHTSKLVAGVQRSGARWVREEFTASALHAGPTASYRWAPYDRVVNAERRAGLKILGLLDYSNTWGYADHGVMPHEDLTRVSADFAAYAYAVAWHYRGKIRYWELWNEPNLALYWHPTPNPHDYAVLLDAASRAIKRANPHARIVLAGTSGVDLDFIRAVAAETNRFDVVSVHPYRPQPESELLPQVQALLALGKPVWISEIGWPAGTSCDPCPNETEQAHYLVRFYALAAASGVQRVFWYDFRDDAHGVTTQEVNFGLVHRSLSTKPAYRAYAMLAHTLSGAEFVDADRLGDDGIYTLRFRRQGHALVILWNTGTTDQSVTLAWTRPWAVALGSDGTVEDRMTTQDGMITHDLPAGGAPIYLLDRDPSFHVSLPDILPVAPRATPLPVHRARPHPRQRDRHTPHPPTPRAHKHVSSTPRPTRQPTIAPMATDTARPSLPTPTELAATPLPPTATPPPTPSPTRTAEPTATPTTSPAAETLPTSSAPAATPVPSTPNPQPTTTPQ